MRTWSVAGVVCLAAGVLAAQSGGPGPGSNSGSGSGGGGNTAISQVALSIPNETVPPGGVAQMKFLVTEPTPISTGRPGGFVDPTMFDAVWGIELFNPNGDVNGVAMVDNSHVQIQYITSSGAQGTDYPVMTMALHVRPDAAAGTQTLFGLDPASTWTLGSLGTTTLKPMNPAVVAVGGSISITNVVPGGGLLPAGTVVSIRGMGFDPQTQVQLNAIRASSIAVVSPNEIQFTLAQPINMTGQKIQVVNPDGSQDTYFSYLRGVPLGQSNQPLLARAVPIFSSMSFSLAVFGPMLPPAASQFTGLAIQNAGLQPARVSVSLYSAAHTLKGSSTIVIPAGYRLMREISELTQGAIPAPGSYAVVAASRPVQMFGFTADNSTGAVAPFTAVSRLP